MEDLTEKKLSKYRLKLVITILIIAASFGVGFYFGNSRNRVFLVNEKGEPAQSGQVRLNRSQVKEYLARDVDFDIFLKVWDIIKKEYVDPNASPTKLFYGALEGLVSGLDDPYSVFLTPKVAEEFSEELEGKFEGIGAEIAVKNKLITVVTPLPDSPAQKAGLRPRDIILEIDAASTKDMSLAEAVNKIRGEKGTKVTLTVVREGADESLKITIVRDTIKVKSVVWERKEPGLAYIKISNFNSDTADLFLKAQKEIIRGARRGVILDLRNNPGGFLETAVDVASAWVNGKVVLIEKRVNAPDKQYFGNGQSFFADLPTVVLINAGSASASEIVAGALQDYKLGFVIGEKSFGKGSVQDLKELPDGSSVKLTVARWYTPNDKSIDLEGIHPDEEVKMSEEDFSADRDPQLDRAVEYLQNILENKKTGS